jgi:hypothetical protein
VQRRRERLVDPRGDEVARVHDAAAVRGDRQQLVIDLPARRRRSVETDRSAVPGQRHREHLEPLVDQCVRRVDDPGAVRGDPHETDVPAGDEGLAQPALIGPVDAHGEQLAHAVGQHLTGEDHLPAVRRDQEVLHALGSRDRCAGELLLGVGGADRGAVQLLDVGGVEVAGEHDRLPVGRHAGR